MNVSSSELKSLGHKDTKNKSKIGKNMLIFIILGEILMVSSSICQKVCLFMMEVTKVQRKVLGQAKRQRRAWGHPYNRDQSKTYILQFKCNFCEAVVKTRLKHS